MKRRCMTFALVALAAYLGLALAACDSQPAPPKTTPAMPAVLSEADKAFCDQFHPPWGKQVWQEWWQNNQELGEKWFTETPGKMKKVDPARLSVCTDLDDMLVAWVPLKNLTPFAKLTKLRRLDIRFAPDVTDLTPLRDLRALEFLGIWGTSVGDLTPLVGLDRLAEINARMTKIRDLSPLARMKALKKIDLLKTPVSDLAPFAAMPQVTEIMTCSTEVKDLAALIPAASRITYLDLCNTPFRSYEQLMPFHALKTLKLWGLPLGDMKWLNAQNFPALEELDLSGASFSSLKPLQGLTTLKSLQMIETKVDAKDLATLRKRLPTLKVVTQAD